MYLILTKHSEWDAGRGIFFMYKHKPNLKNCKHGHMLHLKYRSVYVVQPGHMTELKMHEVMM